MTLEQALATLVALNENVAKNNDLLTRLLTESESRSGAAPADAEKTVKAATTKADAEKTVKSEAGAAGNIKKTTLKAYADWLGEFGTEHPETDARKGALRKLLEKLGEEKISTITDTKKIGQLSTWLEGKGKVDDRGFGPGRFAADPEEDGAADDGDSNDLDV